MTPYYCHDVSNHRPIDFLFNSISWQNNTINQYLVKVHELLYCVCIKYVFLWTYLWNISVEWQFVLLNPLQSRSWTTNLILEKWSACLRPHFRCIFMNKFSNFTDVCSWEFHWQKDSIGSVNDLAPNRRQAITLTNDGQFRWRKYAALRSNEF